ncbi:hypothetical protein EYF80_023898 [Liparis tanakae]|uniref:Uncharacterized protein n=1 Tax=Liparis tanakae TaxID=230148 RepID=A0A4Z2HJA9_9TELE|nr:hypothetical protein EYF80_023898 [Liparis tanakae]
MKLRLRLKSPDMNSKPGRPRHLHEVDRCGDEGADSKGWSPVLNPDGSDPRPAWRQDSTTKREVVLPTIRGVVAVVVSDWYPASCPSKPSNTALLGRK